MGLGTVGGAVGVGMGGGMDVHHTEEKEGAGHAGGLCFESVMVASIFVKLMADNAFAGVDAAIAAG